ncbi:MAG: YHS domain-containing (seleno)protein [Planctomycetota bacterium]
MPRILTASLMIAALAFLVMPLAQAGDSHSRQAPLHTTALGLAGYSPVSYFHADGPHVGSPEFSAQHDGVTYFFANEEELSTFSADPERFAPAYGGWCATGMSKGKYFDVDPTTFKIVDGQLFLYKNNEQVNALDVWNAGDEAKLTTKANAFWKSENGI